MLVFDINQFSKDIDFFEVVSFKINSTAAGFGKENYEISIKSLRSGEEVGEQTVQNNLYESVSLNFVNYLNKIPMFVKGDKISSAQLFLEGQDKMLIHYYFSKNSDEIGLMVEIDLKKQTVSCDGLPVEYSQLKKIFDQRGITQALRENKTEKVEKQFIV